MFLFCAHNSWLNLRSHYRDAKTHSHKHTQARTQSFSSCFGRMVNKSSIWITSQFAHLWRLLQKPYASRMPNIDDRLSSNSLLYRGFNDINACLVFLLLLLLLLLLWSLLLPICQHSPNWLSNTFISVCAFIFLIRLAFVALVPLYCLF